jgi:hypothetical protein
MSDIKHVNINIPIPKEKRQRKTKKASGGDPMPVLSTIRYGGNKKPEVVTNPVNKPEMVNNPVNKPTINIKLAEKPTIKLAEKPNVTNAPPTKVKIVDNKTPIQRKAPVNVLIKPNKRRNFTLRRKFAPKNITIHFENANDIKKKREEVVNKVNKMEEKDINAKLMANGLLRPSANPPLQWKKSMLVDILMFPTRL